MNVIGFKLSVHCIYLSWLDIKAIVPDLEH